MNILRYYISNILTKYNFFVWILLVALLPLLFISYTSSKICEESLRKEVITNLSTVVDDKITLISLFLENKKSDAELFSQNPLLSDFIETTTNLSAQEGGEVSNSDEGDQKYSHNLTSYLSRVKDREKYQDIMIVSNKGKVLFSLQKPHSIGSDLKEFMPDSFQLPIVFKNAVTLLDTQVSDFEKTPSLMTPHLYIASPIFSETSLVGTLIFSVGNEGIESIVNSRTGLGNTGEIIVGKFDKGKIIPQINLRQMTTEDFLSHSAVMDHHMLAAFEQAAVQATKGEGMMRDYNDQEVVAVWQHLPALGWGVLVKINSEEAFQSIGALKENIYFASLLVLLLVIIVAYMVGRRLQISENKLTHMFADLKLARDEAMEADRTKSLFLANMSHELRTPLNAIIGYSEMLEEEAEEQGLDTFVHDLSRINASGKHLLSLINDILDLSKIESGKMEIYLEDIDLKELVDNVQNIIQPLINTGTNVLKIDCDLASNIWRTDVTKIRQCLLNLLSNANKFTQDGLITLSIRCVQHDDKDFMQFKVQDNGIGMTPEQQDRLFRAFTQADASTTRKYGGTGLGLLITKNFCQLMGGTITVESALNKGTTFIMMIPIEIPIFVEDTPVITSLNQESSQVGVIKLLIIDSEIKTHKNITENMKNNEFITSHAYSGVEGLDMCKQEIPDLIVLGVIMPKMDGWAVLAALKADPQLKDIKVVMTSLSSEEEIGIALGATEVLTNPIQPIQLIDKLRDHVTGKSSKVLIVEDDFSTRDLIIRALKKGNFQVMEAVNGEEAIKKIAEEIPSVILLDLMMPKMDGFEVLNRLRGNKDWCTIPVIIVTAKDLTADDRNRLYSTSAIFNKGGYNHNELLDVVRREAISGQDEMKKRKGKDQYGN